MGKCAFLSCSSEEKSELQGLFFFQLTIFLLKLLFPTHSQVNILQFHLNDWLMQVSITQL